MISQRNMRVKTQLQQVKMHSKGFRVPISPLSDAIFNFIEMQIGEKSGANFSIGLYSSDFSPKSSGRMRRLWFILPISKR